MCCEREVPQVDIILQGKGQFAVCEGFSRVGRMVEPFEKVSKGKQALVEDQHHSRIGVVCSQNVPAV